ncbi:MAG: GerAB/ArcD/ProY family transporter [Defluviitaleaceae bacterium]|nr:GerAB/ArcD/ProY family transporter [Defluviitaleaceae bacterium]
MSSNKKISMRQLQILIILSAPGTGVIVFPQRAAKFLPAGAQDGWLVAVVLAAIAIAMGALVGAAARKAIVAAETEKNFSREVSLVADELSFVADELSLVSAMKILLTKPVAYAIAIILWAKLIFSAGFELRIFLEISREIMLPKTPTPIVGAVMICVCAYAAAAGFETRARVAEVLFALMALPFLFFFAIAVSDADFSNLQPIFVNDPREIICGAARLGFILTGMECLLLVAPFVPREKNLSRAIAGAVFFAGIIFAAITVLTIASFGHGVEHREFPVLNMMDIVNLPGSFIERQEAMMFGFWIITTFALTNALIFFSGMIFSDVFKNKKINLKRGVIFSAAAIFFVSCVPLQREQIFEIVDWLYATSGIFFLIVLPVSLILAAKLSQWGHKKIFSRGVGICLILIFALIIFSGCWDKVEIENRGFVVAMGIDADAEKNFVVTLSVPIMERENSDGDEKKSHVQTAAAKTITEAVKKLDVKNDRQLYFGQMKLLVLGTELLRREEHLRAAIETLEEKLVATRRIHVLAADDAREILSSKPPGEIIPGSFVANIYRDKNKIGGRAFALDFERLSTKTDFAPSGIIIPQIKNAADELILSGAAVVIFSREENVREFAATENKNRDEIFSQHDANEKNFSQNKMNDEIFSREENDKNFSLSPEELRGFLWCFAGGNDGAVVTVGDVSAQIENHKADVRFEAGTPLRVVVEVSAASEIFGAVPENSNRAFSDDSLRTNIRGESANSATNETVSEIIREKIAAEIISSAKILQENGVDGYGWLELLRKKNHSLYENFRENWHEIFPEIEIFPIVKIREL